MILGKQLSLLEVGVGQDDLQCRGPFQPQPLHLVI